jgi:hypothetical protein
VFQFIDEDAAFRWEFSHLHNLSDRSSGHNSQPADFERGNEEAVSLIRRHLGRRKHGDLPARFLDRIVQDEIFPRKLADKPHEDGKFDVVEIQRHPRIAVSLCRHGQRDQQSEHHHHTEHPDPNRSVPFMRRNLWEDPQKAG